MSEPRSGCFICGEDLVYADSSVSVQCSYCGNGYESDVQCRSGHYICDGCHSMDANDLIEKFCLNTLSRDPLEMALTLMRNPKVKMHGPEHHFLVPAVLITAYMNKVKREMNNENGGETSGQEPETRNAEPGTRTDLRKMLKKARGRAENVLGGFCGLYGDCGAAVGTGIFISIITGATPLTKESWG